MGYVAGVFLSSFVRTDGRATSGSPSETGIMFTAGNALEFSNGENTMLLQRLLSQNPVHDPGPPQTMSF